MVRELHGLGGTPIHRAWLNMHGRCYNAKHPNFARYGGRGITVCERWHRFPAFHADMSHSYRPGLTLERRDNDGSYHPDNCEWATRADQYRNRCTNVWIDTCRGPMILEDIATAAGIDPKTAAWRVKRGWAGERLFAPRTPRHIQDRHGDGVRSGSGAVSAGAVSGVAGAQ